jgi:hypothetical protein
MPDCIVHFGMHKTGSSSIQQSLYRNLVDTQFRYIDLGSANASKPLSTAFMTDPARYHAHLKRGTSASKLLQLKHGILGQLQTELKQAGPRQAIISGEDIRFLSITELQDLYTMLRCDGRRRVQAVGYIRAPKGFAESAFQQRIKVGLNRMTNLSRLIPDYTEFQKFDQVFGRENISFWKFDPISFVAGDVVLDFCARLGIQFPQEKTLRVNEGLSLPALKLLYAYRKFGPGYGVGPNVISENKKLIQEISILKGIKLRFHSSFIRSILDSKREDIAWMEQRMGASLDEDLTKDDDIGISCEEDLLRLEPETTLWLANRLGPEYENRWHAKMTAQEVAVWMHQLRLNVSPNNIIVPKTLPSTATYEKKKAQILSPASIIEALADRKPQALGQIDQKRATRLITEAFQQIRRQVETSDLNMVKVAALGIFRSPPLDSPTKRGGDENLAEKRDSKNHFSADN